MSEAANQGFGQSRWKRGVPKPLRGHTLAVILRLQWLGKGQSSIRRLNGRPRSSRATSSLYPPAKPRACARRFTPWQLSLPAPQGAERATISEKRGSSSFIPCFRKIFISSRSSPRWKIHRRSRRRAFVSALECLYFSGIISLRQVTKRTTFYLANWVKGDACWTGM